MLRITLKTPDKSVARRMALGLDLELEMVAVKYPTQVTSPDPKMIAAVYKEALEYKRDQIAAIQSRPPFNVELHRRYNSAYSKLFNMMGVSGALPADIDLQDLPGAKSEGNEEEKRLFAELIDFHSMVRGGGLFTPYFLKRQNCQGFGPPHRARRIPNADPHGRRLRYRPTSLECCGFPLRLLGWLDTGGGSA